jgi:hypothetical protein
MATQLTPEQAVERARRLQEDRLIAVQKVAEARHHLTEVQEAGAREIADLQARVAERTKAAERDDVRAYNAALSAGWSEEELRKIGLAEPEKKARAKRRAPRRSTPTSTPTAPPSTDIDATATDG